VLASKIEPEKTLEFSDLLVMEFPEKAPTKDDFPSLVGKAIKNCVDFKNDVTTKTKFENYLKRFYLKNSNKVRETISILVSKFMHEVDAQTTSIKNKDFKILQADPLPVNKTTTTVDMDEESENYTLKVLNNSFGKENIKVLKRQLEQVKDEQQMLEIKSEIEFWESVI